MRHNYFLGGSTSDSAALKSARRESRRVRRDNSLNLKWATPSDSSPCSVYIRPALSKLRAAWLVTVCAFLV